MNLLCDYYQFKKTFYENKIVSNIVVICSIMYSNIAFNMIEKSGIKLAFQKFIYGLYIV